MEAPRGPVQKDRKLAFCPGLTEIQVWDVSDPLKPQTIGHIVNPFMFFPHAAVPSPDGKYLVVGDEAFVASDCVGGVTGSFYIYDISNPMAPKEIAYYQPEGGSTWSSYWYRGLIYANDLGRGLEVLKVDGLKEG